MRSEKSVCPKVIFSVLYIRYLNISHNAPYIFPQKFCISIVFSFSWNDSNTQDKWKTKVMQFFGGGWGGANNGKCGVWSRSAMPEVTLKFIKTCFQQKHRTTRPGYEKTIDCSQLWRNTCVVWNLPKPGWKIQWEEGKGEKLRSWIKVEIKHPFTIVQRISSQKKCNVPHLPQQCTSLTILVASWWFRHPRHDGRL